MGFKTQILIGLFHKEIDGDSAWIYNRKLEVLQRCINPTHANWLQGLVI